MDEQESPFSSEDVKLLDDRTSQGRIKRGLVSNAGIIERREKAFEMSAQGMMQKDIAQVLGVSEATVSHDLVTVARMKYEGIFKKDEVIQAKNDAVLSKLLAVWMPIATSTKLAVGETKVKKNGEEYDIALPDFKAGIEAADRVIKIVEIMSKNHGLQSPKGSGEKIIDPQATGESIGYAVLTLMQKMAQPKPAEVIENRIIDEEKE